MLPAESGDLKEEDTTTNVQVANGQPQVEDSFCKTIIMNKKE